MGVARVRQGGAGWGRVGQGGALVPPDREVI